MSARYRVARILPQKTLGWHLKATRSPGQLAQYCGWAADAPALAREGSVDRLGRGAPERARVRVFRGFAGVAIIAGTGVSLAPVGLVLIFAP
jgi:hypothetical protein